MDSLKLLSKKERHFFTVGAIVVLLLLFFITPYGKKLLSGRDSVFNSTPEIGKIISQTNETKHRPYKEITWNSAKRNQVVHGGDAVLTGEKSSMHVELNKGEKISLGENSLLVFDLIDKQQVVNLQDGNFSLKVNGTVKIAIKGEITEINGEQSEVQIFMDKKTKAPQVKLLSGSGAKITKKNKKPIIVNTRAVANIPMLAKENVELEEEIEVLPEKTPEPVVVEVPQLQPPVNKITYNWKLYDLYEQKDFQLYQKKYRPAQVRTNATLTWSLKNASPVKVQLSNTGVFSTEAISFLAPDKNLNLTNLFIGQNFLRASVDTISWSPAEMIFLEAQFLDNAEPVVKSETDKIPLVKEGTTVLTTVQLTPQISNPLGYIVEASKTLDFATGSTRTFWSKNSSIKLSFYKEGDYYYRFKSVNTSEELSKWSAPIKFSVFMTKAPDAPRLAKVKTDGFVGEKFNLAWNSSGVRTRVEIRNMKNQKVKEFVDDKVVWTPKVSGQYKVQAWTVNEYGQESMASRSVKLNVKDIPVEKKPVVAELPKKEVIPPKEPERAVTSVETNTVTEKIIIKKEPDEISPGWTPSQFSVGSFFRTLQSSQQYSIDDTSLSTNGVMAHGYYWKDTDGFEAYAKASATGATDASGATNSIKDLEARYHYRFRKALFGLEGLQTSIFTGYELYRNSGFLFSSQYDLFKFGTALQLALPRQFTIGGELAFGMGADQSTSFESIGNVNYLFSKNWSFALGYGVHLFEAKSTKSSAQGVLPYREGYTEGLSTLNYRF